MREISLGGGVSPSSPIGIKAARARPAEEKEIVAKEIRGDKLQVGRACSKNRGGNTTNALHARRNLLGRVFRAGEIRAGR